VEGREPTRHSPPPVISLPRPALAKRDSLLGGILGIYGQLVVLRRGVDTMRIACHSTVHDLRNQLLMECSSQITEEQQKYAY
jgi:hypothetical protein